MNGPENITSTSRAKKTFIAHARLKTGHHVVHTNVSRDASQSQLQVPRSTGRSSIHAKGSRVAKDSTVLQLKMLFLSKKRGLI